MNIPQILLTLLIGLITGIASGLMGIGGGAIGTPLLRLILGVPALIALATPMPVMFPASIAGSVAYFKERKIDWKLAGMYLVGAIPLTMFGAYSTKWFSDAALMGLTAGFLIIVGTTFIFRDQIMRPAVEGTPDTFEYSMPKAVLIGLIGGYLAGLLAIGGGVMYVPATVHFFRRPMKVALATSLIVVLAVSIPGSITHALLGHIDWWLVLILSISVIPASFFAAKLALRLRNKTLERIFGIWTVAFGIYFLITQIS